MRLGYVVATHDHADRIGGMIAGSLQVTVGELISNDAPAFTQTAISIRNYPSSRGIPTDSATAGETLALDMANVTVTMLNPAAAPVALASLGEVVDNLLTNNPSAYTDYGFGGMWHEGVEKVREYYSARFAYEDGNAVTVGTVSA